VRIDVNGTGIETEVTGDGPPVLLVHGWPDTHQIWRDVVPGLVDAGFRTIAPDLRGHGASDRPTEVDAYAIPYLAGDVLGVLDHLGVERAHVVGHDWGSAIAWALAAFAPDRVDHLAALSVGHPTAFVEAGFEQRERSWYMLVFQFQGIAETWLSADDFANFRALFDHPDADEVAARLADPGAITASLNLYRANAPPEALVSEGIAVPPVAAPTLGIWSSEDRHLTEAQMIGSAEQVRGGWRYERFDGVGHWIPLEKPEALARLLVDFLPSTV
jgi:pimeloyl-ACP methyl ester carboxylesterase